MIPHPDLQKSIVEIFRDRVERYKGKPALFYKNQSSRNYVSINWETWGDSVRHMALGLHTLGAQRADRIAILSENRPEWTVADLAVLSLGAITVPIYPTSSCPEITFILKNAGVEILFVSSAEQLERILSVFEECRGLRQIIVFEPVSSRDKILSMNQVLDAGRNQENKSPELYAQLGRAIKNEDVATFIYTSGTTGPPKGVMLTHKNFISNVIYSGRRISVSPDDIALSFLPLSHVFERMAGYYFMMYHGCSIAYAENMQTVAENMAEIKPTVAAAVPRFYEKVYSRILENVHAGPSLKQKIFTWAVQVGKEKMARMQSNNASCVIHDFKYWIAQKIVFDKIKNRLGGRLRFFISGGAPLSKELAEFFYCAGILILEGYGLTETSPVIAVNSPEKLRFGTVGLPLEGIDVKIAEDGEILTRGDCVMKGYYGNEKATREALEGGWFHTGDIGLIDSDGFLKITDRKKDIIVTSGGKNISPQNIENLLLGDPLFTQVVVIGDKRNYLVALISANRQSIMNKARELGIGELSWGQILKEPRIYEFVDRHLQDKTKDLASFEQIKYFHLLEKELSQEAGELTPTLKVKRKIVYQKYSSEIEELYLRGQQRKGSAGADGDKRPPE